MPECQLQYDITISGTWTSNPCAIRIIKSNGTYHKMKSHFVIYLVAWFHVIYIWTCFDVSWEFTGLVQWVRYHIAPRYLEANSNYVGWLSYFSLFCVFSPIAFCASFLLLGNRSQSFFCFHKNTMRDRKSKRWFRLTIFLTEHSPFHRTKSVLDDLPWIFKLSQLVPNIWTT